MARREELSVYMHPIELSQLVAIVETLAPRRCLEWGSGGSTRLFLERFPFIERLVSIEHDRAWYEKVRDQLADDRLLLQHVPPDKPMPPGDHPRKAIHAWDARAEEDPGTLATYIGFPATLGERFDFVLVDGRARSFCLKAGWNLLEPGGVIVLHDAQREGYHPAIHKLGRPVFLEPWKGGQIGLVKKPVG